MNYETSRDTSAKRGITLNILRGRQHALNRQMLLAIQLHDVNAQERIKTQLTEVQTEIDRITMRRREWS